MSDKTLERLVAEQLIRRLISAYCDAVCRLDADAAGRLFAPDAHIRIADFPPLTGRDAITDGLRKTFSATDFLHMRCDTGLIDVEGDRAKGRLSVLEASRKPGQETFGLVFGFYEDEYARLGEGWRFFRRRYIMQFRALIPASKSQLVAGFIPSVAFAP